MTYKKTDFVSFSADAQRSIAHLEAAYEQLADIERELDATPSSMFWQSKSARWISMVCWATTCWSSAPTHPLP